MGMEVRRCLGPVKMAAEGRSGALGGGGEGETRPVLVDEGERDGGVQRKVKWWREGVEGASSSESSSEE